MVFEMLINECAEELDRFGLKKQKGIRMIQKQDLNFLQEISQLKNPYIWLFFLPFTAPNPNQWYLVSKNNKWMDQWLIRRPWHWVTTYMCLLTRQSPWAVTYFPPLVIHGCLLREGYPPTRYKKTLIHF